ncbi:MAG TPA: MFS transporter [Candidatus Dormibacteraeota bacterium]
MQFFRGTLWRNGDFVKLWSGQTISRIGTQVTTLALPTAAIQLLHAGPAEIGALLALQFLAFPTVGVVAGVLVDRVRKRPLMIACDVVRFAALGSVPAAFFAGAVSMLQLYAVALVTGVCGVVFEVAYQAQLPALLSREELVEANAKLEVSGSTAQVAGPLLGGVLIQVVRAAPAIAFDALSYLASAAAVAWMRRPEPAPEPESDPASASEGPAGFWRELREGVVAVAGHPTMRLLVACTATCNLAAMMVQPLVLPLAYGRLGLSPAAVAVALTIGSVGSLLGAFVAQPLNDRLGLGPALLLSGFVTSAGYLLFPAAALGAALPALAAAYFVVHVGLPAYNVGDATIRQATIPAGLQARVVATTRTVVWGTIPLGAALGGWLGGQIGTVPALLVAALLGLVGLGWLLPGPVRVRTAALEPAPGAMGGG